MGGTLYAGLAMHSYVLSLVCCAAQVSQSPSSMGLDFLGMTSKQPAYRRHVVGRSPIPCASLLALLALRMRAAPMSCSESWPAIAGRGAAVLYVVILSRRDARGQVCHDDAPEELHAMCGRYAEDHLPMRPAFYAN